MLKYAHSQDKKQSNLFAVLVNFLVIEMLDSTWKIALSYKFGCYFIGKNLDDYQKYLS